jgi:hypothetical protein
MPHPEEFSQINQKDMDKDGKLKIAGKDEVREATGRSPDTGGTFLMRMYFELLKDTVGGTYEQSVSSINRRAVRREIRSMGTSHHSSLMAPAIPKKHRNHNTTCPDTPSKLACPTVNFMGLPSACFNRATTR